MSYAYHHSFLLLFLINLFLLSPSDTFRTSSMRFAFAIRPALASETHNFRTLEPNPNRQNHVFQDGEIKNCLPKGFQQSSTPSHYVNYHKSGSSPCADSDDVKP